MERESQETKLDFKEQGLLPLNFCFKSSSSIIVLLNFQIQLLEIKSSASSLILLKKKTYEF